MVFINFFVLFFCYWGWVIGWVILSVVFNKLLKLVDFFCLNFVGFGVCCLLGVNFLENLFSCCVVDLVVFYGFFFGR